MSWDDDDFGTEFAKFKDAPNSIAIMYNDQAFVLYCEILYGTITDYTSQWNKARKKVEINNIIISHGTPYDSDIIEKDMDLWLDMGARLFKVVKKAYQNKWKYVRIIKLVGRSKFDVHYYISEYKLIRQKTLDEDADKKKPNTVKKSAKK